ncbi:MAG: branched-subunit amino acid ABC-type transport system permease component [Pseudohongiellaceae bacterium]
MFELGVLGLVMQLRQFKGGAASVIGAICGYFSFVIGVGAAEAYIRYREYQSSEVVAVVVFGLVAVALLLQGYRCHRMTINLKMNVGR